VTKGPVKNIARSIHQRLLNVSQQSGRPFNDLLQHYALERLLFRISQSAYRDKLVLKGALLFVAWKAPVTRPTRDVDMLARISNQLDAVRVVIAEVVQTPVVDDGLAFDISSVTTERIAEDADYEGARVKFNGLLGKIRINMQIDIGFSDVVTPMPESITYPTILDHPAPQILAYNRETAIAEKFEALVKLGELNSRMKDFFDIWLLAKNFEFNGPRLLDAIQATFERRKSAIEIDPIGFSEIFGRTATKVAQWTAFARRTHLEDVPREFVEVVVQVREFLRPLAVAISENRKFPMHWQSGGPWRPQP